MNTVGMGEFLAAMRKSMGYTQQEVADRLLVSNKTVSSWERGASCPDIGMLPALAELYGVTCDEIIAGERKRGEDGEEDSADKAPGGGKRYRRNLDYMISRAKGREGAALCVSYSLLAAAVITEAIFAFVCCESRVGFLLALIFIVAAVMTNVGFSYFTSLQLSRECLSDINEEDIYPLRRELYIKDAHLRIAAITLTAFLLPHLFVEAHSGLHLGVSVVLGLLPALLVYSIGSCVLTRSMGRQDFIPEGEREYCRHMLPKKIIAVTGAFVFAVGVFLTVFTTFSVGMSTDEESSGAVVFFDSAEEFISFAKSCALDGEFECERTSGVSDEVGVICSDTDFENYGDQFFEVTGAYETYTYICGEDGDSERFASLAAEYGAEPEGRDDGTYAVTLSFARASYSDNTVDGVQDERFLLKNPAFFGRSTVTAENGDVGSIMLSYTYSQDADTTETEDLVTWKVAVVSVLAILAVGLAADAVLYYRVRRGARARFGV
ncbi:MAG: helix-turn-helix domain-containing protein [Firmicutes bacterium]|nr:helix-turn-helix domain-containing protein [Bacillota bacterium]